MVSSTQRAARSSARSLLFILWIAGVISCAGGPGSGAPVAGLGAAGTAGGADVADSTDPVELVPQVGTSDKEDVTSAAISPDGRLALADSSDGSFQVWDLATRKLIRTVRGVGSTPGAGKGGKASSHAQFLPNGIHVLCARGANIVQISLATGKVMRTFEGTGVAAGPAPGTIGAPMPPEARAGDPPSPVTHLAIATGGRRAVSARKPDFFSKTSIALWDIEKAALIRAFEHGEGDVNALALSSDGRLVLTASRGPKGAVVTLWDAERGEKVRSFEGHTNEIEVVAFSADGKKALSASRDQKVIVWDVATGARLQTFTEHHWPVVAAAFSPDGKLVLSADEDGFVLWSVDTARRVRTFAGHHRDVRSVAFSSDGRIALSGGAKDPLRIWETSSGKQLAALQVPSGLGIDSIAIDRQGRHAVVGTRKGLKRWDLAAGRMLDAPRGNLFNASSLALSPDGNLAMVGGHAAEIFDLTAGRSVRGMKGGSLGVTSVAFSPDGRLAATGSRREMMRASRAGDASDGPKPIQLWDAATATLVRAFGSGEDETIDALVFTPDGRRILTGAGRTMLQSTLSLWDVDTGKLVRTFEAHSHDIKSLAISPDGQWALSGSRDRTMKLWNLGTGALVRAVEQPGSVEAVAFSPDGALLLSAGEDRMVSLWDRASGELARAFAGHTASIHAAQFTPDGRFILSGSADGVLRLWKLGGDPGEAASMAMIARDRDWLIHTDDGYFDASRNGADLVAMVQGARAFRVDQFAFRANRPDLILRRMGLGSAEVTTHYERRYKRRLRKANLSEEKLTRGLHVPEARIERMDRQGKFVTLSIALRDARVDLASYNVHVNGVPLFGAKGKPLSGRAAALTERVELTTGSNRIEVSCLNAGGAESFRAEESAEFTERAEGAIYFLGFGVSSYKNPKLDLGYPHKDAQDLAALFERLKHERKVFTRTYVNDKVTPQTIRAAKAFLKDAKVDDTFVLFIAGHGVHARDPESTYYYVTHDADVKRLESTAASFDDVEDLLQGIAPRRKLFLMDTCESGDVDEATEARGAAAAKSRGIRARATRALVLEGGPAASTGPSGPAGPTTSRRAFLLDRDRFIENDIHRRSGAVVFSSSQGSELSYESDEAQNGFFTKEILAALGSRAADKSGDGAISVDELRDYVSKAVAARTDDQQHPTVDRDNPYLKLDLPIARP